MCVRVLVSDVVRELIVVKLRIKFQGRRIRRKDAYFILIYWACVSVGCIF